MVCCGKRSQRRCGSRAKVATSGNAGAKHLGTPEEVGKDVLGIFPVFYDCQAPSNTFSLPVLGFLDQIEEFVLSEGSCQGPREALCSLHQLADFLGAQLRFSYIESAGNLLFREVR